MLLAQLRRDVEGFSESEVDEDESVGIPLNDFFLQGPPPRMSVIGLLANIHLSSIPFVFHHASSSHETFYMISSQVRSLKTEIGIVSVAVHMRFLTAIRIFGQKSNLGRSSSFP